VKNTKENKMEKRKNRSLASTHLEANKEEILGLLALGVPKKRIDERFNISRPTLLKKLKLWGYGEKDSCEQVEKCGGKI
jgi:hypothetical protein